MLPDCLFSISTNQLQKCHNSQFSGTNNTLFTTTQVKQRYQNYLLNFAKLIVKNDLKDKKSKQNEAKTKTLGNPSCFVGSETTFRYNSLSENSVGK